MSEASEHSATQQAVLSALDALYNKPDPQAKQQANKWLQDFQKTAEAWQVANELLLSQTLPVEPRIFASQTFRIKTTFDLDQVPRSALPSLRSTLLTALQAYNSGPKVIKTQLCITLAGLALQLHDGEDQEWGDHVVEWMIEKFGKDPNEVQTLLDFLTVLPEEATANQRIPIDNDHYNQRTATLLAKPAPQVIKVLTMYSQAQGLTTDIQNALLSCLASWLRAGEVGVQGLLESPLFNMSFDSLMNEQLFDVAVDVVCDIIHETQEVHDNQQAIQMIVPRLLPLRDELKKAIEEGDDDKVRGLCRIFVQAGETYHRLILQHQDVFVALVQAIYECATYSDLDIVQITFRFWYYFSRDIQTHRSDPSAQPFLAVYQQLLEIIIKHLRFPDNMDSWTGQERDDFKSFRHYMGDTLKDCCQVLGSKACLTRSFNMIQEALSRAQQTSDVQWQDVEAPLFSMRAMGAEADPHDDEVLPRIMDIIPSLPSHPRLTYAGLLVISRYTEWFRYHADRIPSVLSYISAGFNTGEADVAAAAAQAINYLGQDCSQELIPFLPQLYDFYQVITGQLEMEDIISVSESIAYVIASMPAQDATQPLVRFTQPLLQDLAEIGSRTSADKQDLRRAADRMEQIERFIYIASEAFSSDPLPPNCSSTCQQAYQVLDSIMEKHGSVYFITERSCALIRRGLVLFGDLALPAIPSLSQRLVDNFHKTEYASYVWIVGKCIDRYGGGKDLDDLLAQAFQQITSKILSILDTRPAADIPDVIDDYIHTCSAAANTIPQNFFLSGAFPQVFGIAIKVLEHMYQTPIVTAALDFVRDVIGNDALETTDPALAPRKQAITQVIHEQGGPLVGVLLHGMVSTFDSDAMPSVVAIVRILVSHTPADQVQFWIATGVDALNTNTVSVSEKHKCMQTIQTSLANRSLDGIRPALQGLFAASRKSRERERLDRQSTFLDA